MLRYCLALAAAAFMAACEPTTMSGPVSTQPEQGQPASFSANESARSFIRVLQTVEPVAERECRVRTSQVNCDFNIVVDDRPGQPANAYQTEDKAGRPVIAFTLALIADARNEDELAFVMGHEAAHHI